MNLPRDAGGFGAEACPLADRCVVTAVEKDVATLSSLTAGEVPRLMALKFLGHFMGDLHQPLHVSFQDDRGGNSVDTTGVCGSNLHSAWDTCLLKKAVGTNPQAAAFALEAEITDADRAAWVAAGPIDWANESFAITIAAATRYCVAAGGACQYEAGNVELDQGEAEKQVAIDAGYVAMSTPIIRDRLKRAGFALLMSWMGHWAIRTLPSLQQHASCRFRSTAGHDRQRLGLVVLEWLLTFLAQPGAVTASSHLAPARGWRRRCRAPPARRSANRRR